MREESQQYLATSSRPGEAEVTPAGLPARARAPRRWAWLAPAALLALLPVAAQAQDGSEPSQDWTPINLAVTDAHVLPRYAVFAERGASLTQSAQTFCAAPDAGGFSALRGAYHDAMDAWQGIAHVQFGPITYFNWNYRLQFWPDDNNTGGRQLSTLLATADASVLEAETFARQSVGVQGFPALERLLFEEEALGALQAAPYRCNLLVAIAANIADISQGVHQRWVDEFRATVANADDRGFFESAEDATIDFLKSLVESFPRLRDQKLDAALGESQAQARVRRAESWRSERSLRNLKLNVAGLAELFGAAADGEQRQLREVFHAEDSAALDEAFARLQESLAALPDSLVLALSDAELYAATREARDRLDATYEAFEQALKNTDLYLGFNSLDGD